MGDGNIKLIYFLVNAALVVLAIGAVAAVVGLFGNGHLSVEAEYPRLNTGLPEGIVMTDNPTVSLDVADPTTKQRLLSFGIAVVQGLLIALGLWLLRGVAGSVKEGDPFGRANVKRLRGLGFLLVLGAPIAALIDQSLRWQLVNTLPPGRYGEAMAPSFGLPVGVMLAGVGTFVLAEVFAYGVRLREDVEATI
jgi:Protein of unknown function (DUF2975)